MAFDAPNWRSAHQRRGLQLLLTQLDHYRWTGFQLQVYNQGTHAFEESAVAVWYLRRTEG
jgi:hypothetical protein